MRRFYSRSDAFEALATSHYSAVMLRTSLLLLTLVCPTVFAAELAARERPEIDGEWWQIARNPDLGPLSSPTQEPVDFAIWRAADGAWQLSSCVRGTKEAGKTRLF